MKANLMLLSAIVMIFAVIIIQSCNKKTDSQFLDTQNYNPGKTQLQLSANLSDIEQLGKNIYFDKLSDPIEVQGCFSCHAPEFGFGGAAFKNIDGIYEGAVPGAFGNRMAPSAAYASFSPMFHYDEDEGLFAGGIFWDGRATGERLSPTAEQALGPFLNPVEQHNPNKESVLTQIAASEYATLWQRVWGAPLTYSTQDEINTNYDRVGLSIAAYESSPEVNQFSSKYDLYLKGAVKLTSEERQGLALFNGKAKCNACHSSAGDMPLFTDFTYDNLGIPKNPNNPYYATDPGFIDYGLGEYLATRTDKGWNQYAEENMGKFKVPTLRNVGKMEGKGKRYMHNGVFGTLKEVVHFYNSRDEMGLMPEVNKNVNMSELGNLKLTPKQEDAIVAFMRTLSDGYVQ